MADRFDEYHGQVTHTPFALTGTAATTIVTGVTGQVIIPLSGHITCSSSVCVTLSDTNSTNLSNGTFAGMQIDSGIVWAHNPHGCLKPTGTGYGIRIQLSAVGPTVSGMLVTKNEVQSYS